MEQCASRHGGGGSSSSRSTNNRTSEALSTSVTRVSSGSAVGMGCTPSVTSANATNNNKEPTNGTATEKEAVGRHGEEAKSGSGESAINFKSSSMQVECSSGGDGRGQGCVLASGKVTSADEDSENESASFLCANLRRNFMQNRGGARSRSNSRCRHNGSSSGLGVGGGNGGGKQTLTTTAEEQSEHFLSSEDGGDSNPLLKRSANPAAQGDIIVSNSSSCNTGPSSSPSSLPPQNLPHYVQLQQYHQFHCGGRKLSSQSADKVFFNSWNGMGRKRTSWNSRHPSDMRQLHLLHRRSFVRRSRACKMS